MSFDVLTNRNAFFAQMEREMGELIDPATGGPRAELVETIDCPSCRKKGEPLMQKWGFTYERCPGCDLIFVNPRLRESAAIELYKQGSKANEMWAKDVHSSPTQKAENARYFAEQLALLERFVPAGGSIVDVGCGNGDFLALARERGYRTTGLELGQEAVAIARQKGLEILEVLLGDPALDGRRFDAVTLFGVLEHLYDPARDLGYVRALLQPGGVIMGITPNAYGLVGMLLHEEARFYTPRNHPVIFGFGSLQRLLDASGFAVAHFDTVLTGYESIVNSLQYRAPFGPVAFDALPPRLRAVVADKAAFERLLLAWDLGLRLRVVAKAT